MLKTLPTNVFNELFTFIGGLCSNGFYVFCDILLFHAQLFNKSVQEKFLVRRHLAINVGYVLHRQSIFAKNPVKGLKVIYMYYVICLGLFVLCNPISAQTNEKVHYYLHADAGEADLEKYARAIDAYGRLDMFRFIDSRRTISFAGTGVSVELCSASELKQMYGKAISPRTIVDAQQALSIEFVLTEGGFIKERIRP